MPPRRRVSRPSSRRGWQRGPRDQFEKLARKRSALAFMPLNGGIPNRSSPLFPTIWTTDPSDVAAFIRPCRRSEA